MTPYLEQLLHGVPTDDDGEEQRRRDRLAERLAAHSDPLLREIGDDLRTGRVRPRDLPGNPAYRAVFERTLERITQR